MSMNIELLHQAGIDYEKGVERFLGDRELYETVLHAFREETTLQRAQAAFSNHDDKALLDSVHEAKGSSGNADMTVLYQASCALVSLLRQPGYTREQVEAGFFRFRDAFLAVQSGIAKAEEE